MYSRRRRRETWEWLVFVVVMLVAVYLGYVSLSHLIAGVVMFVIGFLFALLVAF